MIFNGELSTPSTATLYTVPEATPGSANSGELVTVNFFRIVNESGAARTFTLYLNVSGTDVAITPIDTELPDGAAFDDVPTFQLPPSATIRGSASGADVSWTINVE